MPLPATKIDGVGQSRGLVSDSYTTSGAGWMKKSRQNIDIESDKVLEEIWHTVDRELPTVAFRRRYCVFSNVCEALIRMRADAFGACLCCRKPIGLKRQWKAPWTPLCIRCQSAADRNDGEILRRRSQG